MNLRVLIADDAPFIHEVIKAHLKSYKPAMIESVYDGEELLRVFSKVNPHIVFVDMAMPKKNGLQAVKAIISKLPHTKIIGISSMADESMVAAAISAGCVDFLDKGFKPEEFKEAVDSVLAYFAKQREVVNG